MCVGWGAESGQVGRKAAGECRRPIGFFDSGTLLFSRRCLCWKCESCARVLSRSLYARLMDGLAAHPPVALLTFTVRRLDGWTPAELGQVLAASWRRWLTRLRQVGVKVGFFRVVEFHRSGVPHLHVLVTGRIPSEMLSHYWNRIVTSVLKQRRGDCSPCRSEWVGTVDAKWVSGGARRAVGYLLKYLSKGLGAWRTGLGFVRRWGASRNFLPASLLFARRSCALSEGQERRALTVRRLGSLDRGAVEFPPMRVPDCLDESQGNVSRVPVDYFLRGDYPDGSAGLPGPDRHCRRADNRRKSKKGKQLYGETLPFEVHSE